MAFFSAGFVMLVSSRADSAAPDTGSAPPRVVLRNPWLSSRFRSWRIVTWVTPLFVAMILIEIVDLIFAVDSVPAIFAITTDPYIVYTSNIFAILGLRALYFALAAVIDRFTYLKPALAMVLVFIGAKIFVADLLGWEKFPAAVSLAVTLTLIAGGIVYSLWRTQRQRQTSPSP